MTEQQKIFLDIIKSGLSGEKAEIPSDFDFKYAVSVAKKHQLLPIFFFGIRNSEITLDSEIESELTAGIYANMVIDCNQMNEAEELKQIFRTQKIDFAMLKGSHLKSLFPKSVMRSMSDFDILIRPDQIEAAKELVKARGYIFITETDHVTEWAKGSYFHLELHKKLVPSTEMFGAYYSDSWKYFYPVKDGENEYVMLPSDEYIFIFLHFTKHYISGGVGIRQMLDLWVFSEKEKAIDYGYVEQQLETLGLVEFWKNICDTLQCWMNGAISTEKTDFITDFIFSSGVFGTRKNYLISTAVKSNEIPESAGRRRIFQLFFLPYSGMCIKYPVLKKYPVLLPFYWVKRLITALFFKRKKGMTHLREFSEMNGEEIKSAKSAYEYVGLNFNSKE